MSREARMVLILGMAVAVGAAASAQAEPARAEGVTRQVSVRLGGAQADGFSLTGGIAADERVVAFDSGASNLVLGDTNLVTDVFVHVRRVPRGQPGG